MSVVLSEIVKYALYPNDYTKPEYDEIIFNDDELHKAKNLLENNCRKNYCSFWNIIDSMKHLKFIKDKLSDVSKYYYDITGDNIYKLYDKYQQKIYYFDHLDKKTPSLFEDFCTLYKQSTGKPVDINMSLYDIISSVLINNKPNKFQHNQI